MELNDKPTTLILDEPKNVAPNLVAEDNTLGVRLVTETFCYKLMERMKVPLVSTSANVSSMPTPNSFKEIDHHILFSSSTIRSPDIILIRSLFRVIASNDLPSMSKPN